MPANLETNQEPEKVESGAAAVGESAMDKAREEVQSDSTTSNTAKSSDSKPGSNLGLPFVDFAMHEAAHAGGKAGAEAVASGVKGAAESAGAKAGAEAAGQAAVEGASMGAKGGAALGEKTGVEADKEKNASPEDQVDLPPSRSEVMDDLKKWVDAQGANLNQKELADKLLEFAKTSDMQWNSMLEMDDDRGAVDKDTYETYSKFTDLLMDKLTDQGEMNRIKDQIPWTLRPGE